ncbi:hypothetical protein HDV05_000919 [Chytridiales sp. JEL 0842]|nr:hypothetical protein HDV05_000919 [Chytridiales sp. JEL 0842]
MAPPQSTTIAPPPTSLVPPPSSNPIPNQTNRASHTGRLYMTPSSSLSSSLPVRGFVTGPPTRAHWKPDSSSPHCESCQTLFNLLTRRHHCRVCGGLFCGPCSSHLARLDQSAKPHPAGVLSRICSGCFHTFERLKREETGALLAGAREAINGASSAAAGIIKRASSMQDGDMKRDVRAEAVANDEGDDRGEEKPKAKPKVRGDEVNSDTEENDTVDDIESTGKGMKINNNRRKGSLEEPLPIQSVPSDWAWSTF